MELAVTINDFTLLSFGVVWGILPCLLWGILGGDEGFTNKKTKTVLSFTHHWQIGIIIMIIGVFTNAFVLGWGLGTAVDDLLFHSFENYFAKKKEDPT